VRRSIAIAAIAALVSGCGGGEKPDEPLPSPAAKLQLRSPAFRDGGTIPKRFSCDGPELSPPLRWSAVPRGTRELVLVVEDPDADRFVHWTVLGIERSETRFEEGGVPAGAVQTKNSFGKRGWGGPCPPEGDEPHRYVFALYATDAELGLGAESSPDEVRSRLAGHSIARGTLTGRLGR
jgi:Raf kinase inhibitor-like YbhB/YbcL family protein